VEGLDPETVLAAALGKTERIKNGGVG